MTSDLSQWLNNLPPEQRQETLKELGVDNETALRPLKNPQAEAVIQRQIIDLLIADGWLVIRINGGARQENGRFIPFVIWQGGGYAPTIAGVSDLICLKEAKSLLIECKRLDGKQSDTQRNFQLAAVQCGVTYVLARSVDDVAEYLDRVELL